MNALKCAFSVTSITFLGFVARHRGITIDQVKIKGIQQIQKISKNYRLIKAFGLY